MLFLLLIHALCSFVLLTCAWTSCNLHTLLAEMNLFERLSGLQSSFRIQSLTLCHWNRFRHFKFKTGLLNISEQHLLKIENFGVYNSSRCPCWTYWIPEDHQARRPPRSADYCYHKFKNVSKAGVRVSNEINLFKALLITTVTPGSCL